MISSRTTSKGSSLLADCGFQICNLRSAVFLLLSLLAVAGCGPGRERGTLTGSVKFRGTPVTEGTVIFSDEDNAFFQQYPIRPDGTFEVSTQEGKGIWAGKYRVAVAPPLVSPEMGVGKTPASVTPPSNIPKKYWKPETSGIQVEVKEGQNDPLAIEMK